MFRKSNVRVKLLLGAAILSFGFSPQAFSQPQTATGAPLSPGLETPGLPPQRATVMVGGAEMSPARNIIENASMSKDHSTLVSAIKAADLVGTLSGTGPFTVFAPTNEAFAKLAPGTVDNLLKPENKDKLAGILKYHVVPGRLTAAQLESMADDNGGKVTLKTTEGDDLIVMKGEDDIWWVSDTSGNKAQVKIADVIQSNGVIFVIDSVLMPKTR